MSEDAERIYKELLHEKVSLWYINDQYGSKVMVKAPAASIRALRKGCRITFSFGKDCYHKPAFFHTAVNIYDDPVHYLSITGTQRFAAEHSSLQAIMEQQNVYIHFHDELCICAATATLKISEDQRKSVIALLGEVSVLYTGDFNEAASASLDVFQYSLGLRKADEQMSKIETLTVEGILSDWIIMKNHIIGANEYNLIIADSIEGKTLEKQVWASMEALFDGQLYLSPEIIYKKGRRELTDIFAFSEYGLFLIESKALNVLTRDENTTMDRKVIGIQHQIEKAINQLVGAAKKIAEGTCIYDSKGNEIIFNRSLLPHCIVLVSELFPFGNWDKIVYKIFSAMLAQPMQLNVMDMKEFMYFIGSARGSRYMFDYLLMQRTESFVHHQDIHAQAQILPKKTDEY